jgi:hypothetical protein
MVWNIIYAFLFFRYSINARHDSPVTLSVPFPSLDILKLGTGGYFWGFQKHLHWTKPRNLC